MEKLDINILYFDDEVENLTAFKANFRKYYKIHTATTPQDAIAILSQHQINVLLIDQRMPQLSGIEFLEVINEEFPYLIKIMVSGYIEYNVDAFNQAMEKGDIFKYIGKPWSDVEMKTAIEDAYNIHLYLKEKNKAFEKIKYNISNNLKGPIANLEGLITLANIEINDEYAMKDYLYYMNQTLDTLKTRLGILLASKINAGKETDSI
ncbi:MAG: response regulator [Cytophagaceae bacterium]|nr:response regulator [Cytophagaceae bacterium]